MREFGKGIGCVIVIVVFLVIAGIITAIGGFFGGWFDKGAEIVGPQNVEQQYDKVITTYEGLVSSAGNACTVQAGQVGQGPKDGRSSEVVESPILAYEATYRSTKASYNSTVDDLFKAGIVKPNGYPTSAEINAIDTTDWCTVESQLLALKP